MNSWKDSGQRSARELARAVGNGRSVGDALRHLDVHASEPDAVVLAEALANFLVDRCDSHHAGWRAVRRVVVDSSSDPPWEKCARRAVPDVAQDLLSLSGAGGRTPLGARSTWPLSGAPSRWPDTWMARRCLRSSDWMRVRRRAPSAGRLRSPAPWAAARASRWPARLTARSVEGAGGQYVARWRARV